MSLVLLVSCTYLWISLQSQLATLGSVQASFRAAFWPALVIGCVGTLLLGAAYHVVEVRRLSPRSRSRAFQIALAYSLGQIARYIPGKIIGVALQVKLLEGRVPPTAVVLALLVQTLYDYWWAIMFCGIVLWAAAAGHAWIALPAVMFAALTIWLAHRYAWCERLLLALFPKKWSPSSDAVGMRSKSLLATTLLVFVWLPLLAGLVAGLHGKVDLHTALQIGCYYILAAMASLIVVVVPSGIAIREAIFVWLGREAGADPALLVFLGIAIRICLTIAEVATALIFVGLEKIVGRRSSSMGTLS